MHMTGHIPAERIDEVRIREAMMGGGGGEERLGGESPRPLRWADRLARDKTEANFGASSPREVASHPSRKPHAFRRPRTAGSMGTTCFLVYVFRIENEQSRGTRVVGKNADDAVYTTGAAAQ